MGSPFLEIYPERSEGSVEQPLLHEPVAHGIAVAPLIPRFARDKLHREASPLHLTHFTQALFEQLLLIRLRDLLFQDRLGSLRGELAGVLRELVPGALQ